MTDFGPKSAKPICPIIWDIWKDENSLFLKENFRIIIYSINGFFFLHKGFDIVILNTPIDACSLQLINALSIQTDFKPTVSPLF